ncbi:hypothetical protein J6590_041327 [Homalodisca vitripennis]|nr:hypothetical protein J6590_041327 [Homalodisca vitripennis]
MCLPPVKNNTYEMINGNILRATTEVYCVKDAVVEEIKDKRRNFEIITDIQYREREHGCGDDTLRFMEHVLLSEPIQGKSLTLRFCLHFTVVVTLGTDPKQDKIVKTGYTSLNKYFIAQKKNLGVRFTSYIGDGDTANYSAVCESKPHGPNVSVVMEDV